MKQSLIDTDILSMFFKGNSKVKEKFNIYLKSYKEINFSIITYYEIISGLKHRDAKKQMDIFLEFASQSNILPLTTYSTEISATIYSNLRKKGTPVDDIDLLIAGVALENELNMVTNNTSHFNRIEGLEVNNWSV
ncbi:MAG: type II toxin-antitoxin system VapC family toxin [Methylococcales bacterium]|jgi:tRNA(fMet)-specific endonuclease VapC|nr:type II toxin-antitoxin system VapC family toxin [Methylococcales bacterium]